MPKTTLRYNIQSWLLKKFAHIKVFKYPLFITYNPTTFKLKSDSYYAVRKLVKPGDILLRGYDSYLDGYCIPGLYSHAAIYVGWSPNGGSFIHGHSHGPAPNRPGGLSETAKGVGVRWWWGG